MERQVHAVDVFGLEVDTLWGRVILGRNRQGTAGVKALFDIVKQWKWYDWAMLFIRMMGRIS